MLDKLPIELVYVIFSNIKGRLDFKSLSEVSRQFNKLANPFLYTNIIISTPRKDNGIIKAHQRAGVLLHTRDIQVWSEKRDNLLTMLPNSCSHLDYEPTTIDDERKNYAVNIDAPGDEEGYEDLSIAEMADKERWIDSEGEAKFYAIPGFTGYRRRVLSILIRCREGSLRSFGWYRKDCIPPEVMGRDGYLPTRQKFIESLHIDVASFCTLQAHEPQLFTRLKSLTWNDLGPVNNPCDKELKMLRRCLEANSHQLVHLGLEVSHWEYIYYDPNNDYATISGEIVKAGPDGKRFQFPVLQHLSLEGFNFGHDVDLLGSLDPEVLNTLTIRVCPSWPRFLDQINAARPSFHLRTVEIQSWTDWGDQSTESMDLVRFLDGCEPLENFYVSMRESAVTLEVWQSLLRHRPTLKSFTYYSTMGEPSNIMDTNPYGLANLLYEEPYYRGAGPEWNPLGKLDLELLGINYNAEYLMPVLSPLTTMARLEVLIIRCSWFVRHYFQCPEDPETPSVVDCPGLNNEPEENEMTFDAFAQWAFGPDGFRSLQLIALGDFSSSHFSSGQSEAKYEKLLICPKTEPESEPPFPGKNHRVVTRHDRIQQDLLRKHAHALQACPSFNMHDI
ncbi:uncharacterized protein MCYG_02016 [Microsporum canis CBS 113480]|uniref:F-box domain-containing protein n=1 Tax=Arthroderma otae (strain ATCC MYA-4605 / CBS 113480) TaxID=554155 RepID=C5FIV6_ARTOC|nr:uncharacterized protein MCYG_02016 [Microsporum canis CBS 113480]EEQ29197.1 predicted protein [Microsporum canis CBS 113480]